MLVTEPSPSLPDIVRAAVAGGVDIVQWRDHAAPPSPLSAQVSPLRDAAGLSTLLMVNGPPLTAEADGIHRPEAGTATRDAEGTRALMGRSVHSVQAARLAQCQGAHYLVAGTVYPSQSHPDGTAQGVGFLREVCRSVDIPVLAIGGITPERVGECIEAGAAGVAVLSPIMRAADPQAAARAYRTALDTAWKERQCS